MEVSLKFEAFQAMLGLIRFGKKRLTDSGFSQEDLVSNLIGFYIGIGEVPRLQGLLACKPVSDKTAQKIWDRDGSVGKNKNKTWTPKYPSQTGYVGMTACIDECAGSPQVLPKIFQRIRPATKGVLFRDL